MKRPIIGITADSSLEPTYSKYPWYALRENYVSSLTDMGAIGLILPHQIDAAEDYLTILDGLLITGGDFDINPSLYGQKAGEHVGNIIEGRTNFEWKIFDLFFKANKPILGICGGQQLINVALEGSLIQHLEPGDINHQQMKLQIPPHQTSHSINIIPNSKIYSIFNALEIHVNSSHHQAVDQVGKGLIISAKAPDGVIEVIEHEQHPFCIGVQWHPEYLCTGHDKMLFKSFIDACR
jgi:putative glutamine amidotransferase